LNTGDLGKLLNSALQAQEHFLAIEKGKQGAFAKEGTSKKDGGSMIPSKASDPVKKKL
jgi:hypothetical protein